MHVGGLDARRPSEAARYVGMGHSSTFPWACIRVEKWQGVSLPSCQILALLAGRSSSIPLARAIVSRLTICAMGIFDFHLNAR